MKPQDYIRTNKITAEAVKELMKCAFAEIDRDGEIYVDFDGDDGTPGRWLLDTELTALVEQLEKGRHNAEMILTELQLQHGSIFAIQNMTFTSHGPGVLVTYHCEPHKADGLSGPLDRCAYFTASMKMRWSAICD